jgi:hypothetical protein
METLRHVAGYTIFLDIPEGNKYNRAIKSNWKNEMYRMP